MVAVFFPSASVDLQLVIILFTALVSAAFGAWAASMVASSIPNSRLRFFESAITAGHILMMVDTPSGRVSEIRKLVAAHHPEAMNSGIPVRTGETVVCPQYCHPFGGSKLPIHFASGSTLGCIGSTRLSRQLF